MFMFFMGFLAGWWACNWYVQNGRSFERAFVAPAQDALGDMAENGRGTRATAATTSRRARRA